MAASFSLTSFMSFISLFKSQTKPTPPLNLSSSNASSLSPEIFFSFRSSLLRHLRRFPFPNPSWLLFASVNFEIQSSSGSDLILILQSLSHLRFLPRMDSRSLQLNRYPWIRFLLQFCFEYLINGSDSSPGSSWCSNLQRTAFSVYSIFRKLEHLHKHFLLF
ncbi:hypothetical protein ISN45_Aa05g024510 [Arabidopsis thaliana x Arabidopsis arenosa]|uniref:Uncharacterized protein n=1 Tax=Arabidopsis thaliana x Arabidopsis arenosa TaxID=1240361 RepID=A0A8T1ZNJ3_9BRAS|nr:hypothetical protein ISN45_Aa05g024510 [Arabidopsis thaliana x Arabidopsis arenosa]